MFSGIAVLLGGVSSAGAWGTGNCFDLPLKVHARIAENVLDHPTIKQYLARFNLNRNAIVSKAKIEPQCYMSAHPSWLNFQDRSFLSWPMNHQTIGAILHVAGDSGVASCHSPANEVWCNQKAEAIFEANAELHAVSDLTSLYADDFSQKLAAFRGEALALARQFRDWWARKPWYCPPSCNVIALGKQGQLLGQKLGQAALLFYFESMRAPRTPTPVPARIVR
jgi:hypothetical protein